MLPATKSDNAGGAAKRSAPEPAQGELCPKRIAQDGSCTKGCCGSSKPPRPTPAASLALGAVTWKGRVLDTAAAGSSLNAIAERLGGVMGGDETGTICLVFGTKKPDHSDRVLLVKGEVKWVVNTGSLALYVNEFADSAEAQPAVDNVARNLVVCRSAPIVRVAVCVLGGEDAESYRVLIRKNKTGDFELPWTQPAESEGLRETAGRLLPLSLPAMLAKTQLTALQSTSIHLDEGDGPESLIIFTARLFGKVKGSFAPAGWLWLAPEQVVEEKLYAILCVCRCNLPQAATD